MGSIAEFSINLNTNQHVYYPGTQVYGFVVLNLSQPMNMRGLRIHFEGKAHCHWTEEHGTKDERRTQHYGGNEKYFDLVSSLFGGMPNAGSHTLPHPAGRHIYPFMFALPTPLPSSFEGTHGHIRYVMKAQIDLPWKIDPKVKRAITINEIIDPNLLQYGIGPGGENHKTVGCCCCAAGTLDVMANIDRGCYCPGEVIYINAKVGNHTTRDMNGMKARLYQVITYHGSVKTKHETQKVAELKGPQVMQGQFATWENQAFGIPALPPSIFNSRVITISYEVQLQVDVPWGFDPCIKMPIVMGTVPYRPTYGEHVQYYGTPEDPQQAPAANYLGGGSNYAPPQPSQLGYPDMAPPSYSAVIGATAVNIKDGDDDETAGELSYMPVYTFARPYEGGNTLNIVNMPPSQPAAQCPPVPPAVALSMYTPASLNLPYFPGQPAMQNHPM